MYPSVCHMREAVPLALCPERLKGMLCTAKLRMILQTGGSQVQGSPEKNFKSHPPDQDIVTLKSTTDAQRDHLPFLSI